jgi:SAM-dependent methyltransferase
MEPDGIDEGPDLSALYRNRFTQADLEYKRHLWETLCEHFFQRYVRVDDTVLDLGAGTCDFVNSIRCARKIAVDLNPDTADYAVDAVVYRLPANAMGPIETGSIDVVFCSNFFEHLPDKRAVHEVLLECRRVLRDGGRLLVLQPNIRYLPGKYWDYLDHHTPLTHLSMVEALELAGFAVQEVVPRFLPYTVRTGWVPRNLLLVRLYLKLRVLWPILGRQMWIAAKATGP